MVVGPPGQAATSGGCTTPTAPRECCPAARGVPTPSATRCTTRSSAGSGPACSPPRARTGPARSGSSSRCSPRPPSTATPTSWSPRSRPSSPSGTSATSPSSTSATRCSGSPCAWCSGAVRGLRRRRRAPRPRVVPRRLRHDHAPRAGCGAASGRHPDPPGAPRPRGARRPVRRCATRSSPTAGRVAPPARPTCSACCSPRATATSGSTTRRCAARCCCSCSRGTRRRRSR